MKKSSIILLYIIGGILQFPIAIAVWVYRYWRVNQSIAIMHLSGTQSKHNKGERSDTLRYLVKRSKQGSKKAKSFCIQYYHQKMNNKLKSTTFIFKEDIQYIESLYYQSIVFDDDSNLNQYIKPNRPKLDCFGDNLTWIAIPNTTPKAIKQLLKWDQVGVCNWNGLSKLLGWNDIKHGCYEHPIHGTVNKHHAKKLKVAAKYGIFVSPAIDNWCFIIDFQELLPHHTALRNNLLETLSQAFEHAFYFTKSHPPEQLYEPDTSSYSIYHQGQCIREANWVFEVMLNEITDEDEMKYVANTFGDILPEESALGIKPLDENKAFIDHNNHVDCHHCFTSPSHIIDDLAQKIAFCPMKLDKYWSKQHPMKLKPSIGHIINIPSEMIDQQWYQKTHEDG